MSSLRPSLEPLAGGPHFPNEACIPRLIGAVLFEQNDDWQSQHRSMMDKAFARIDPPPSMTAQAA